MRDSPIRERTQNFHMFVRSMSGVSGVSLTGSGLKIGLSTGVVVNSAVREDGRLEVQGWRGIVAEVD